MFQAFISIFKFFMFFHIVKKLFFLFGRIFNCSFSVWISISSLFAIFVLHNFEMAILRTLCRWSTGISDNDKPSSTYPKNLHLNFVSIWYVGIFTQIYIGGLILVIILKIVNVFNLTIDFHNSFYHSLNLRESILQGWATSWSLQS